jgi:hypothetical protein
MAGAGRDPDRRQVGFVSNWTVPANAWSHVAMTYDGSLLRLYINGMDAGSRPATGSVVPASPPLSGVLGGTPGFAGSIDEVRLFRRALSAAEIAADTVAPAEPVAQFGVTAVTPADLSTYVTGSKISATFNRAADAASVHRRHRAAARRRQPDRRRVGGLRRLDEHGDADAREPARGGGHLHRPASSAAAAA